MKAVLPVAGFLLVAGPRFLSAQTVDLPTSKQLIGEIPGHPQRLNSLPMSMAISPDGRYVVTVNAGYGTVESKYEQSLAVLDTETGVLADFPDDRTRWTPSRRSTPASPSAATASTSTPAWPRHQPRRRRQGRHRQRHRCLQLRWRKDRAGAFHSAAAAATCSGQKRRCSMAMWTAIKGVPYPAAIAVIGAARARKAAGGRKSLRRCPPRRSQRPAKSNSASISLKATPCPPPIPSRSPSPKSAAAPSWPCGMPRRSWSWTCPTARWTASCLCSSPPIPWLPGTHPCAFELSPDGKTLYVALANRDAVAAVECGPRRHDSPSRATSTRVCRARATSARSPRPSPSTPTAAGSTWPIWPRDAVAVIDTGMLTARTAQGRGWSSRSDSCPPSGCPSPWRFCHRSRRQALCGHGQGQGNRAQRLSAAPGGRRAGKHCGCAAYTYIATLLYGSLAALDVAEIENEPAAMDRRGDGVQPHEGGRRRRSALPAAAKAASST